MVRAALWLVAVIGLGSGCSNIASADELLASELFVEERSPGFHRVLEGDPRFHMAPIAWRAILSEHWQRIKETDDDPCEAEQACWDKTSVRVTHKGKRLLSAAVEQDLYLGGAHGMVVMGDFQFDLATGKSLRFGDIFTSWEKVRPTLQSKFCKNLREERFEDSSELECPRVEETALVLVSGDGNPHDVATVIEVHTSDYQLGGYASGRETIEIGIDQTILSLIKTEYRDDIAIYPNWWD